LGFLIDIYRRRTRGDSPSEIVRYKMEEITKL